MNFRKFQFVFAKDNTTPVSYMPSVGQKMYNWLTNRKLKNNESKIVSHIAC